MKVCFNRKCLSIELLFPLSSINTNADDVYLQFYVQYLHVLGVSGAHFGFMHDYSLVLHLNH